jgi:prevent-host-death family protein
VIATAGGNDVERVGTRELCERAGEILRRVRDERSEYIVTYEGSPVARLIPIESEREFSRPENADEQLGKDHSLTQQTYGLVPPVLTDAELEAIYLSQ